MSQFPVSTPNTGMRPHRGTLILVLGIIGIFCLIPGIIAWVMGNGDLKAMDAGQMDPAGRGQTNTGKILGIVGVCLAALGLILNILMMVLAGGAAAAAAASNP